MRSTMPRVAPMVRRIAMSRPLPFTSMYWPERMLKAATRMISERIRNMTLRSTWIAVKKLALACCQSTDPHAGPDHRAQLAAHRLGLVRVLDEDLHGVDLIGQRKKSCAASSGHVDEAAVVLVHADLEQADDLRNAFWRGMVPKGTLVLPRGEIRVIAIADALAEALRHADADQDHVLAAKVVQGLPDWILSARSNGPNVFRMRGRGHAPAPGAALG